MQGTFDEATKRAYDEKTGVRFTRASVVYYLPGFSEPQSACLQRGTTPSSLQCLTQTYAPRLRASLLYLDCGRWGGDGGGITDWPRCRDFGVVFGRAAAICGYGPRQGRREDLLPHETASAEDIAKSSDCQMIVDFVGRLTCGRMGPAQIWQMLDCPIRTQEQADEQGMSRRDRIYVFLGDLHLPVADEGNRAELARNPAGEGRIVTPGASPAQIDPNSPMMSHERADWYNRYHGTSTDIGADVFQHARADLEEWLQVLCRYQVSPPGAERPIHLIQTGDMFDFWIGLHRYFSEAPGRVVTEPVATNFVDYWLEQTITRTDEGRVAQALEAAAGTLNVSFLYGNHDNYLARLPAQPQRSGITRRAATFSDRDAANRIGSVWAEHGHRWDAPNADGATGGHLGTQTAFFWPPVRDMEDQFRKGLALIPGQSSDAERIVYLGEVADQCLANGTTVFVMGHTHHGLVKRIDVVGPPR